MKNTINTRFVQSLVRLEPGKGVNFTIDMLGGNFNWQNRIRSAIRAVKKSNRSLKFKIMVVEGSGLEPYIQVRRVDKPAPNIEAAITKIGSGQCLHESTFEYLKPSEEQIAHMAVLRAAAKNYSDILEVMLPDGPDKTYIMRAHRANAMWNNVAITRNADGSPRT
jgi:hypothetical protein